MDLDILNTLNSNEFPVNFTKNHISCFISFQFPNINSFYNIETIQRENAFVNYRNHFCDKTPIIHILLVNISIHKVIFTRVFPSFLSILVSIYLKFCLHSEHILPYKRTHLTTIKIRSHPKSPKNPL